MQFYGDYATRLLHEERAAQMQADAAADRLAREARAARREAARRSRGDSPGSWRRWVLRPRTRAA